MKVLESEVYNLCQMACRLFVRRYHYPYLYFGWAFRYVNFKSEYALFALWDADLDPQGRNQHPTRQGMGMFDCHAVIQLRVKWPLSKTPWAYIAPLPHP